MRYWFRYAVETLAIGAALLATFSVPTTVPLLLGW